MFINRIYIGTHTYYTFHSQGVFRQIRHNHYHHCHWRPLLDLRLRQCAAFRTVLSLSHPLPMTVRRSSLHLVSGRAILPLPSRILHSRNPSVMGSSIHMAHGYFSLLILRVTWVILVPCRITSLRIVSLREQLVSQLAEGRSSSGLAVYIQHPGSVCPYVHHALLKIYLLI